MRLYLSCNMYMDIVVILHNYKVVNELFNVEIYVYFLLIYALSC